MAAPSTESTVRKRRFGSELRRLRERAGLNGKQAAAALQASDSMVSRIELGSRVPRLPDLNALLDAFGVTGDEREAVLGMAEAATRREWFAEYADALSLPFRDYLALESEATVVHSYQPLCVSGIFQTEAYARAVTPETNAATAIEKLVRARMQRQTLLSREDPPEVSVVLEESVLRRPIGGASVLKDQLAHLTELAQRPGIEIRVLPLTLGSGVVTTGPFTIVRLPWTNGVVVYVENAVGGNFLEDEGDVFTYDIRFSKLQEAALSPEASVEVIARIGEELGAND